MFCTVAVPCGALAHVHSVMRLQLTVAQVHSCLVRNSMSSVSQTWSSERVRLPAETWSLQLCAGARLTPVIHLLGSCMSGGLQFEATRAKG
jgi:hypothetical protein